MVVSRRALDEPMPQAGQLIQQGFVQAQYIRELEIFVISFALSLQLV
jgi:hypothetical protein